MSCHALSPPLSRASIVPAAQHTQCQCKHGSPNSLGSTNSAVIVVFEIQATLKPEHRCRNGGIKEEAEWTQTSGI